MALTPATCAGTTFITTLDGYSASPPGTYSPTRRTGTQRWVTVPPGAIWLDLLDRQLGGVADPGPGDRLGERCPDLRCHHIQGRSDHRRPVPAVMPVEPRRSARMPSSTASAPLCRTSSIRGCRRWPWPRKYSRRARGRTPRRVPRPARRSIRRIHAQISLKAHREAERSSPRSSAGAEWVNAPTAR